MREVLCWLTWFKIQFYSFRALLPNEMSDTPTPRVTVAHSTRRKGAKLCDTSLTHDRKTSVSCSSRYRSSKIEIDFLGGPGEDKMPRHSNGKRQVRQRYECFLYSSPRKRQKPVLFRSHIKCCCRYLTHHCLQLFLASGLTWKKVCVGFNRNPLLLFLSFIKSPRKPEMERKRRQRINKCLSQIKLLIPEAKELEVTMQTRGVVPLRRPVFVV